MPKALNRNRRLELFSRLQFPCSSFRLELENLIENASSIFGLTVSPNWRAALRYYVFAVVYSSSRSQDFNIQEHTVLINIKRRIRVALPVFSFQIQTTSLPPSITAYPIVPCLSHIFNLCLDGELDSVRTLLECSLASSFAVNPHGENLLHVSRLKMKSQTTLIRLGCCSVCSYRSLELPTRYRRGRISV